MPHLLLHLPHRLVVCGSVEGVPAQQQQLDQVPAGHRTRVNKEIMTPAAAAACGGRDGERWGEMGRSGEISLGHVASRDVEAADVGGQRVALVDRDDVRHSVA